MNVISRKFADELVNPEMRHAYLEAQTRTKLAHQIRALRQQRGWSQHDLGAMMGKPQSNIARLENPDVARYTLSTLLELAFAFDVGFVAEFMTYEDFLRDTASLDPAKLQVGSFSRDALSALYREPDHFNLLTAINVAGSVNPVESWNRSMRDYPDILSGTGLGPLGPWTTSVAGPGLADVRAFASGVAAGASLVPQSARTRVDQGTSALLQASLNTVGPAQARAQLGVDQGGDEPQKFPPAWAIEAFRNTSRNMGLGA